MTSVGTLPKIDIDEADILVLSRGLEKTSKLTYDINKSLSQIVQTSDQSTRLFVPILSRNNELTILQKNIESTLNSVASVKDLATEASKYEILLTKGIKEIGIKNYTQLIHRLDDMAESININNKQNAEFNGILIRLTEVIKDSEANLRMYFVAILNTIKPFDPQINMNKKIPFPYYEDQQLSELSSILDYFYNNSDIDSIQESLINERSQTILKSMAFLEPFAKRITTSKNAPYEKGSSGMNPYTEAILGFIANEKSLIDDICSQYMTFKEPTLDAILKRLLKTYSKLINYNLESIKGNLDNTGIFSFELVESVQNVRRSLRFSQNLQNLDSLVQCSKKIDQVTQSLFKDTIQRIGEKVNRLSSLPTDNGVTESTVDTMSRLRKLGEFQSGCITAISSMERNNWLVTSFSPKDSTFDDKFLKNCSEKEVSVRLLSCFFSDCIDTLCLFLEKRAEKILGNNMSSEISSPALTHTSSKDGFSSPKHKQRIGYFILMNISLVEQIVEKSSLSSILGQEGNVRIKKLHKRYVDYMVADWKDLTAILMDAVFIDSAGKKSKDKEQIKEKFKRFNDGFEALESKTKQYRLTDPALKKRLKSEIVSLIIPMYERFYGRYKDSFKNPRKHIKYTPTELTSAIDQVTR
ncbi:similar to Saccharomyces cerevisiae YJL085W EXO70 Subunit of the exocyst complex [Maudiozyma saulgeensis]|uniref:Exocyst complex protein EXO70 n=1 Tax=Maudiozyma saulgeensis TaxID=1789683 RepID=A0A1X7R7S3_9SACH|nr:similar to Saccharomyces cerevisiae YJL085W EXO70 Subunit of the exocyst complex [Kazachstania saulgeensis]